MRGLPFQAFELMMAYIKATAAVLCAAALLTGCSKPAEPSEPLVVDLTPESEPGTVTPPFWVVEDAQTGAQVFLLGSMHAGTEDTKYPEYVLEAYRSSSYIAPELDTVAFEGDNRLMAECAGYLRMESGTAADIIPQHDEAVDYFRELGIYNEALESMKPFYWTSLFSSVVLSRSGLQTEYGTENAFLKMAHRDRKEICEIEGAVSQYKMMGSVPESVQTDLLGECIGDDKLNEQVSSTQELFDAWSSFDDGYFSNLEVYDPEKVGSTEDWQAYYNMMYADRQQQMADFVLDALGNGDRAFVFVGTMHFYAEPSIIDLLGEAGYTVSAIRPQGAEQSGDAPAA